MDLSLAQQPVDVLAQPKAVTAQRKLGGKPPLASIERSAKEFESVFMAQMLKPMWSGVETDPVFGGGAGEDVMRDMLVQEYGKAMAQADDFGLSKAVMDVMIRMQEQA